MAKAAKLPSGVHWKDEPEEHDFPAASDYLGLSFDESDAAATSSLTARAGSRQ